MWSTDSLLKTNSCTSFSRAKGRSFLQEEPWDYTEVVREDLNSLMFLLFMQCGHTL